MSPTAAPSSAPALLGLDDEPLTAKSKDPITHHVRVALDVRLRSLVEHTEIARVGEDPEGVHQMRTSVRRMRAVLKAARPMLEAQWADALRAELGWLGRALGPVRDLDVLLERLYTEAETFPEDERGAVDTLVQGLVDEREAAREDMLAALDSERFRGLLVTIAESVQHELPTSDVDDPPALIDLVHKEFRKLRRDVRRAGENPPDDELHALRIRGKRVRYTAELVEPALGKPVRRLLKATTAFQDVLGDHQDAHVADERVRALLDAQGDAIDWDIVFVAGRLVEREVARRAELRELWWPAWEHLESRAEALFDR
ncbi:CHAD domain-containing protein [Pseudonocardiaceae bacterium YIM PH 21723]|nr:CHAD domain-containing protein [Pseudonocardiaceae bacterium YIM PH 21723]